MYHAEEVLSRYEWDWRSKYYHERDVVFAATHWLRRIVWHVGCRLRWKVILDHRWTGKAVVLDQTHEEIAMPKYMIRDESKLRLNRDSLCTKFDTERMTVT